VTQDDKGTDPVDLLLGGLDRVLDTFHDRVLRPVLIASRFLAMGFVLLVLAVTTLVAFVLGLLRFSDVFIFQGYVWLNYLSVGFLCVVGGLIVWRFRRPAPLRKK
jgi:hypothetical protein